MTWQVFLNQAVSLHQKGKLAEAENLYLKVLAARRDNFQAQYLLAVVCYQQLRGPDALQAVEAALKLNPNAAEALTLHGVLLQRTGRLNEALASFDRAVAHTPAHAEAWYNRGVVLAELKELEEAVAAFDRALAVRPNADTWNNRGVALHNLDRDAEALASFDKALLIRQNFVNALNNRGSTLQDMNRIDEAIASFDNALAIEPDNADTLYNRGGALQSLKRMPEALASYDRALAVRPNFVAALTNRAIALQNLKRFVEALDCFDKVLAVEPDNVETLISRSKILQTMQRFKESLASLDMVLTIRPDHPPALLVRSAVLCESNRIAEGLDTYMRHAELVYGNGGVAVPGPAHKRRHDVEQRDYLAAEGVAVCDGMFNLADGERLTKPAVNPVNAEDLAMRWKKNRPQVVVIDNLLAEEALEKLRRFCWGSTVWRRVYSEGYLGAMPDYGFACPLLAQIADELRNTFPAIFSNHALRRLWAFKYDSSLAGIKIHADQAAVNVNFWITPDEANLNPEKGGLVIWDVNAPLGWDVTQYNGDEAAARAFLTRSAAKPIVVPYRANRAVIFDSDLFHETDTISFRQGYLNRRINITMLYGRRTFDGS